MKISRVYHAFTFIAGIFGLFGIIAGAVAAHAIHEPDAAARVSTAALYALIHAAVLLGWHKEGWWAILIKSLFVCGVIFFSGSLILTYAARVTGVAQFAPLGGTILLLGWLCLILTSAQSIFFLNNKTKNPASSSSQKGMYVLFIFFITFVITYYIEPQL